MRCGEAAVALRQRRRTSNTRLVVDHRVADDLPAEVVRDAVDNGAKPLAGGFDRGDGLPDEDRFAKGRGTALKAIDDFKDGGFGPKEHERAPREFSTRTTTFTPHG